MGIGDGRCGHGDNRGLGRRLGEVFGPAGRCPMLVEDVDVGQRQVVLRLEGLHAAPVVHR